MLVRKDETFNSINAGEVTAASGFSATQRGVDVSGLTATQTMAYKGSIVFTAAAATTTVTINCPFVVSGGTNITVSGEGSLTSVANGKFEVTTSGTAGDVTVTVA